MKQPELGRKVAELRKAKGLTQEELVEKCKLNVRTLQRIEAGEATPRSYTVKIIFAALDYNIYDSSKSVHNKFQRMEPIVLKWLEQLYKYVIDLFNLKTNTMKKIMILSVPFLTLCLVLIFSFTSNVKAQARKAVQEKFEKASSMGNFVQLFNAGKMDSISMQYLNNACMMPDNSGAINGRENIKAYYSQLYNSGLRFNTVKSLSRVISDSLAVDRGEWTMSINSVVIATGTYLSQWHYVNGNWLIENEMTKADNAITLAEEN